MREFVPSEWCLRCQRCCRFSNQVSPWIPVFSAKEAEELIARGYPLAAFNKDFNEEPSVDVRVKVKEYKDYYICPFFDPEKNCCDVYPLRPFDCRLYPFLLVRRDGVLYLGVDKECPFVEHLFETDQEWHIQKFTDYLVDYLASPEGRDEVGTHPSMIAPYPGNIMLLREIRF